MAHFSSYSEALEWAKAHDVEFESCGSWGDSEDIAYHNEHPWWVSLTKMEQGLVYEIYNEYDHSHIPPMFSRPMFVTVWQVTIGKTVGDYNDWDNDYADTLEEAWTMYGNKIHTAKWKVSHNL